MAITLRFDPLRHVFLSTFSGQVSQQDLVAHWTREADEGRRRRCRRTLVDARDLQGIAPGVEIQAAVDGVLLPAIGRAAWVMAIVVRSAMQFGVARQFQTIAPSILASVFADDLDAAMRWLDDPARLPDEEALPTDVTLWILLDRGETRAAVQRQLEGSSVELRMIWNGAVMRRQVFSSAEQLRAVARQRRQDLEDLGWVPVVSR